MKTFMLVRLNPHDPKKGLLLKQYTYQGIRFQAGRGWYKVNGQVAAYLESVHSVPGDNDTPLAFDVWAPDEARAMDEKDRKAARQVVPAEQALDVSHVGDEQPRAKSRPGPDRDDALRRQRRDSDRMPENMQRDALDDEDMEDETPRRQPSRRRAGAVSRRPRAVVEDFGELDDGDDPENDDVEDEAPRRRVRRGRAGGVPRRRLWAEDEELDDVEPGDEVDEFDDDEFDDAFDDDEREDMPPPPRHRSSLPPRSRAPRARRIQRYAVEHDALDDDDRQIRSVRGPRQAEALDALRNREARRMRRQHTLDDRYEELPRSRSQGRYQDELHIRHARQMAAKLEEIDALDDAMSYGDAEDSLPNNAKRNRHDNHGDAEDSLPTTTRSKHVSQRDAEDSLPGRATRYGDAEDSLPGKGARSRHSGHGDAEDSLSTRDRHSYGDAEDSLPHRRKQQDAPSSRHTADAQDDLDAVEQALDDRNVEGPARSDARSQRAQQPPSSAAHDELDALDDALDDDLDKASEDQRPGSAQPHARGRRAQQPPSSAAHDELDALDDALDDDLDKASEDQRPGSAQPQHGQQGPKRCAIYTRKSTAAGLEQDFNSLDAQREACEQYIASRAHAGWYLLPERYDDGGFTGANLERPAFQKLMQDIEQGKVDIVITYKVDRLSRSLLDFARIMDVFQRAGVSFVSVTQNFSTADAMGRLTLNMLMSFAEFEREMIAERTRDKMAAARKKGKWIGGRVPLGYRVEGGKLVIDEDEAVLVRELFRVYQEEKSLVATADVLNARGWRTKKCITRTGKHTGGLRWDKGSVHRQLTNPVYVGKVDFQGQIYEGEHEAIIDEATFARVQQLLKSLAPDGSGDRRCRLDFLLRGLLRCRVCSSAMTPRWSTSRGREYRYYVCTRVSSSGRQACSVRSVPANAIEEFVVKQIRFVVEKPEMLARVTDILQQQHSQRAPTIEQELAQLTAEHRRCREEGWRVLQAIGEGNARQSSMVAERLSELDEQAHQLEHRMAELRDELAVIEQETVSPDEVQRAIALFDPIWDMLFPRERSRVLHLLLESAVYDGIKGELELQFYPLGISRLAAESAMVGQTAKEAA